VLFDGQSALVTSLQDGLITATISFESFVAIGEHEVEVQHVSNGETVYVGKFLVYLLNE